MRRTHLFLALIVAAVPPACSSEPAEAVCDEPVATTAVTLADFEYEPVCVKASAGDTLTFTNTGGAPHTYTVSDTDVSANIDGGETGEVVLGDIPAGTYHVTCTYHPQMVGALKIV